MKPSQDHNIFYYHLDFDHNQFYFIDKFKDPSHSGGVQTIMFHLNNDSKFRIYHTDITNERLPRKSYHQANVEYTCYTVIKEEMNRNEFFSQYALGTLKGTFIATRDVKYLRKYLEQNDC